jgi:hypothetical protein
MTSNLYYKGDDNNLQMQAQKHKNTKGGRNSKS